MGYPMNYTRVIGRNNLVGDYANRLDGDNDPRPMIRGDLRRLEKDSRDEAHLLYYATAAGITATQAKAVLDAFFDGITQPYVFTQHNAASSLQKPEGE